MGRVATSSLACALAVTATAASAASAALAHEGEERSCDFLMAVLPSGDTVDASQRVDILSHEGFARIRIANGGEWDGARVTDYTSWSDTILFDTGAARETITISAAGQALWEMEFRTPPASAETTPLAYFGTCTSWEIPQ